MTIFRSLGLRSALILCALSAAACVHDPDPNELLDDASAPPPDIAIDTQSALAAIANQAYTTSAFKLASLPRPSEITAGNVVEWVSADAAATYAQIDPDPDASAPNVTMPTGSIVVRAVYDLADAGSDGAVQYLTLIVKGPSGTDQSLGDWWFAVTDPNGTPLLFPDGGPQVGPMTDDCHACHTSRGPANDYLFGVPQAYRAPSF